jgi:hypothetical protein
MTRYFERDEDGVRIVQLVRHGGDGGQHVT